MKDPRLNKLAKNLVNYSVKLQANEKVLINCNGHQAVPLVKEIIKEVYNVRAYPFVKIEDEEITREIYKKADSELFNNMASWEAYQMEKMDAFIGIGARNSTSALADIPGDTHNLYMEKIFTPVHHNIRIKKKWVVLRYPTNSMAQSNNSSLEDFEDFYFNVCNLDYGKMSKAMDPLVNFLEKTDIVKIKGPGTDLSFSIKGIDVVKCDGGRNIPDGEVYTAPVKNSINGTISYNTPAVYQGFTYENISFKFKNGKIVKATANNNEKINKVLNIDEGARYIGEFAIGVNPYIINPMKNTLFDEKIKGSFHLTPGNCYEQAFNGNKSSLHWDLVSIQTKEYGGGEIWFDDRLIRKDGKFIPDELKPLDNLG